MIRKTALRGKYLAALVATLAASNASAWEAKVTDILQHGTYVAVYLTPDPGPGACQAGQPYLLVVNDSAEAKQRFAMILAAQASGRTIAGWADGCDSALWGVPRPLIWRLMLKSN